MFSVPSKRTLMAIHQAQSLRPEMELFHHQGRVVHQISTQSRNDTSQGFTSSWYTKNLPLSGLDSVLSLLLATDSSHSLKCRHGEKKMDYPTSPYHMIITEGMISSHSSRCNNKRRKWNGLKTESLLANSLWTSQYGLVGPVLKSSIFTTPKFLHLFELITVLNILCCGCLN